MAESNVNKSEGGPSLEFDGAIARITLRRPSLGNALDEEDLKGLLDHIESVNQSDARVLLVDAMGKHFCTGFNITSIGSRRAGPSFAEVVDALEKCRPVSIAVIQGAVYGGATDLALACDFRIGCEQASMRMPAARLGLHFYPSGMRRYVSRLGLNAAKRLFLLASRITAQEMLSIGALTDLVPCEALADAARDRAMACANLAPLATASMKKHLNALAEGALDETQFDEDLRRCEASSDLKEGVAAWSQKREPIFVGR